ncbi:geranylgeranyl transferase type-2 subunit alpha [Octopus sinensis]|uniref:Geranylgeranyl transferase type-2 subunit alpha n=1 Tax=Octopus sinensis TaxID=2607531 RepID=A0A6P7TN48_9MOLL|nr:geranylgeranyl transferase type-2 subunit alpha [Octopus sinensis]
MHGRVKVRTTAEQAEVKRKEREKKLQLYSAALEKIFDKRNNSVFDEKGLSLCAEVLLVNPDFYTLWNFRKEILVAFKETRSTKDLQRLFEEELSFIESCLRVNPKSYGSWDHRIFVQQNIPHPNWTRELALCNKFLEYDERNFHCWDYRRFVVKNSNSVTLQDEFDFTTTKICNNFSNYSSWHYRSKLLPLLLPDPSQPAGTKEEAILEEFEIVQNAMFTDPDDQSAWFYHRWLLGRGRVEPDFLQVIASRATKTLTISVTKPIHPLESCEKVEVSINDTPVTASSSKWHNPFHNDYYSPVWILPLPKEFLSETSLDITVKLYAESTTLASCTLSLKESTDRICYRSNNLTPDTIFNSELSAAKTAILAKELEAIQELLQLETENKWAMLTVVQLMQALNSQRYSADINNYLNTLSQIDPKRDNYYKDYKSKVTIENQIKSMDGSQAKLVLKGLDLSTVYHLEHLVSVQVLDLSSNNISRLHTFAYLQSVESLDLDHNKINSIEGLGLLPNLTHLSLRHNCLLKVDDLRPLQSCAALKELNLEGNALTEDDTDYRNSVQQLLPQLTHVDSNPIN